MNTNKPITLSGYAIVFNSPSNVLCEQGRRFREIILPEAVTQDFINQQDVILTLYHDFDKPLARHYPGGGGDLRLTVDSRGVKAEVTYQQGTSFPDLETAVNLVARGVLPGMSFQFTENSSDDWAIKYEPGQDGIYTKYIRQMVSITDVSFVRWPAYKSTSCSARETKIQSFTPTNFDIFQDGKKIESFVDLTLQRSRLEATIGAVEAREAAGQNVDVSALLDYKSALHKINNEIMRRKAAANE